MKCFKTDSEIEKKVQQVESLMRELGLAIIVTHGGVSITHKGKEYPVRDLEHPSEWVTEFPRCFESERLTLLEV